MRRVHVDEIASTVKRLCIEANYCLPSDIYSSLQAAQRAEENESSKQVLTDLLQNAAIAAKREAALCQDTGMIVIFMDIGQSVQIVGGLLSDAVNAGVRQAYQEQPFRYSVVQDPLFRTNTGDNTPAVLHLNLVSGDVCRILLAPKGFGSENMSRIYMLSPAEGWEGVQERVLTTVAEAGPNPCPPVIVGVGLGGTLEKAALLAKRALFRPVGQPHPDPRYAELEQSLLRSINASGIGPGGIGGRTTALAVHIDSYPTHIAGLPLAINMQCHSCRHQEAEL
jgi:fumarate hydratase subunit alpha